MLNNLSDEKSKEVLEKVIQYRQVHSIDDRPKSNRKNQYFPGDIITLSENEVL